MEIISLSQAKPRMGRLIDRALKGEAILIRKGGHLVQLTEYVVPEPIPQRPMGYFRRASPGYDAANRAEADPRPVR
jgi:antitoxin (DNA-binding transcriptional repressor) of toxin-antitoxin stability system